MNQTQAECKTLLVRIKDWQVQVAHQAVRKVTMLQEKEAMWKKNNMMDFYNFIIIRIELSKFCACKSLKLSFLFI